MEEELYNKTLAENKYLEELKTQEMQYENNAKSEQQEKGKLAENNSNDKFKPVLETINPVEKP